MCVCVPMHNFVCACVFQPHLTQTHVCVQERQIPDCLSHKLMYISNILVVTSSTRCSNTKGDMKLMGIFT